MKTLKFTDIMAVSALVNHAQASPEWSNAFYDESPPAPSLVFVKDDGIYLMSNGIPRQAQGENVVYAKGYNPKTDGDVWDKCRDAVGGDDFAEYLPVEDLLPIPENAVGFFIKVSASSLSCGWLLGQNATRAKVRA